MASLTENRPLLYSLLVTASTVFILASGLVPDLSATLEITPFTDEVSILYYQVMDNCTRWDYTDLVVLSPSTYFNATRTMVAVSPHYSLLLPPPSLSLPPPTPLPLSPCFLPVVPVQPAGHLGHGLCPFLPCGQNSLILSWHGETQISTLQLVHIINRVIQNSPLCI